MIDKVSDLTNALNINGAVTIKYGDMIDGTSKGDFVNLDKIKESSASFLITAKVINQTIIDHQRTRYNPIKTMKAGDFTDVFGDSLTFGFQKGGEFNALITIKGTDKKATNSLAVNASINLTNTIKGKDLEGKAEGRVKKAVNDLLKENETTLSVSWTGGGQDLKNAAMKFPDLVAETPMRTHAVLTKYTALRSFYTTGTLYSPMIYENAGSYTTMLQDSYLDYKNLYKFIHHLALDFEAGKKMLHPPKVIPNTADSHSHHVGDEVRIDRENQEAAAKHVAKLSGPSEAEGIAEEKKDSQQFDPEKYDQAGIKAGERPKNSEPAATGDPTQPQAKKLEAPELTPLSPTHHAAKPASNTMASVKNTKTLPPHVAPLVIDKPYAASLVGLERAKRDVRYTMNRIVAEVDHITHHPESAVDESREALFMTPLLFKQFLSVYHLPYF